MTIPDTFAVTLNEPHSIYVNFALTANCSRQSNGDERKMDNSEFSIHSFVFLITSSVHDTVTYIVV
jgi:hypothetical protein